MAKGNKLSNFRNATSLCLFVCFVSPELTSRGLPQLERCRQRGGSSPPPTRPTPRCARFPGGTALKSGEPGTAKIPEVIGKQRDDKPVRSDSAKERREVRARQKNQQRRSVLRDTRNRYGHAAFKERSASRGRNTYRGDWCVERYDNIQDGQKVPAARCCDRSGEENKLNHPSAVMLCFRAVRASTSPARAKRNGSGDYIQGGGTSNVERKCKATRRLNTTKKYRQKISDGKPWTNVSLYRASRA